VLAALSLAYVAVSARSATTFEVLSPRSSCSPPHCPPKESGELTPAVPLTPAGPSVLDGNGEVIEQLAGVEEFRTSR
jgi:hypothetical protein